MRGSKALCVLVVALGLHPAPAVAQTTDSSFMRALELADVIAEAEIVERRSHWDGGLVVTTVTAEIVSCLRGRCPNAIVRYDVPGGEIDGVVQVVSGSWVPRVGQAVVLLLEEESAGFRLVSTSLGQLPASNESNGARRVQLPGRSVTLGELRHLALTTVRH